MADADLEQRVTALEEKFRELERRVAPTRVKDWRRTVGMFAGDPLFKKIVRLGREYREKENQRTLE